MNEEQIQNFRLQRIAAFINERFDGNKSAFAKDWTERLHSLGELEEDKEIAASIVHRWFWKKPPRQIGSRTARKIEHAFNLPPSSLDQQIGHEADQLMVAESKAAYLASLNDPSIREVVEELVIMSPKQRTEALTLLRSINATPKKK